jgi:hypothetical protein
MADVQSIPFKQADPNGHYRSKQLPNDQGDFLQMLGLPSYAGDVVGPGGATAGQAVIFSDATGKRIDAATQTGLAKLANGLLSAVPAPVGTVVGTTDVQTLTNKTLTNPTITGLTGLTKNDVGLGNVDNTSDANKPVSGPQQTALNLKEDKANKGVALGYPTLDASGKVPAAQLPSTGASVYQGTWNAATNSPTIPAASAGNNGWYYNVSVAGTTNINGISSWAVGDQIISNGTVWQKIPSVQAVNSVNGYTGVVVLTKSDVGLGNVDNTSDANKPVSSATTTQLNLKEDKANKGAVNGYAGLDATGKVPVAQVPANLVTSVAGKQGVVTLVSADVGLGNVDNTSDATKNAAAVTLTNKTINGANNTLTVRLANDVTGNLPITNLNSGTGANSGSFWRGDGQWAPPAGGGDVVGPAGGVVDGEVVSYSGTTGKVLKASGGRLAANLVAGPASSVATNLATYTDTTGKLIGQLGKSALTTDFLDGTNAYRDLVTAVKPTLWSVRTRSYNAMGNANFEVDQVRVGGVFANTPNAAFICDRWMWGKVGTMQVSTQQIDAPANTTITGSNMQVTNKVLRITLTTAQASLAAGEYLLFNQNVEGPSVRELINDVTSLSLLVRSSVANLKFTVAINDSNGSTVTRSITYLCTLGAANTFTYVTLPNIPVMPSAGQWLKAPGSVGSQVIVCLGAGTTFQSPGAGAWQSANYFGLSTQDNFASKATSSTFDMAFVQLEPGSECTGPIDVAFRDNLFDCQRYMAKSYNYAAAIGSVAPNGSINWLTQASAQPTAWAPYPRPLATSPTPTIYSPVTGAGNAVRDLNSAVDRTVTSIGGQGENGFGTMALSAYPAALWYTGFHYHAQTVF